MFWTRVTTSIVIAPVAIGAVYLGYPVFHIFVALVAAAIIWEFVHIVSKAGFPPRAVLALWTLIAAIGIAPNNMSLSLAVIAAVWLILLATDKRRNRERLSSTQTALLYAGLPAVSLVSVREVGGAETVFWVLAVVWATDIGAYFVGRLVGGPKLAPSISPGKTWSGAFGGIISAIFAGLFLAMGFGMSPTLSSIALAILVSIVSQFGDLAESRFKRVHGVKDSGTWMPGHGGVMDRVDGLWAATPAAALICALFGGGLAAW
ncbi:MAG: phosphatidate cytidylyltransferase [Rhodospirillaceae bacterium]|nr:phosphatidate cytidylyltransferase [Rhodospirillaceae bacterium]